VFRSLARIGLLTLLQFATSPLSAADLGIDLVLSGRDQVYEQVADAFVAGLETSTVRHSVRWNRSLAVEYVPGQARISVAIGIRGCEAILDSGSRRQRLCIFVPEAGFRLLTQRAGGEGVAAIYLDQPVRRQLALARALLPNARVAGLLAGPGVRSRADLYREAAGLFDFSVRLEPAANAEDTAGAIPRLLSQSDAVVAVYEPTILTPATARWLLRAAHHRRVPIIGYSKALVDSGALAAVFTDPDRIGRQAAETVVQWLRNRGRNLQERSYPSGFGVAVNRVVASALGISVPKDAALVKRIKTLVSAP
jgi:putative ABC transport system substrate-binding protein